MFCPNCGMDCKSEDFCAVCETDLTAIRKTDEQTANIRQQESNVNELIEEYDLQFLYDDQRKNKESILNEIIEEYGLETLYDTSDKTDSERKKEAIWNCPRCGSARVAIHEREYKIPQNLIFYYHNNSIISYLVYTVILLFRKKKDTVRKKRHGESCSCLDCGNKWRSKYFRKYFSTKK